MFNRNGDLEHKPGKKDDAEKAPEHSAGFDLGKTLKQAGDAIGRVQNDMIERVTNAQVQKQYVASISPALASQYARGREIVLSRSEAGKSTSDLSDLSASELKAAQTYQRLHSDLPSKIPFYNKETLANDLDRDIVRKARSQPQPVAEVRVSDRPSQKAEARLETNVVTKAETKPASKLETAHNDLARVANPKEQRQIETRNEPKTSASNSVERLSDKHSDKASGKSIERIANQANISESSKISPGNALLTSLGKNKDDSSFRHESSKPEMARPVPVEGTPKVPGIRAEAIKIPTIETPSSQMVAPNIRLINVSQSQIVQAYRDGGISVVRQLSDRVACAVIRVDLASPKTGQVPDSKPSHDAASTSTSTSTSSSKPISSSSLGAKFVSESKLDAKPESKLDPKPDLRSAHMSESKPERKDVTKIDPAPLRQEIHSQPQKNSNLDSNSRQINIQQTRKTETRGDESNSAPPIKPESRNESITPKQLDLNPDAKPDSKPSTKVDTKVVIIPSSKSESKTVPVRSENRQENKPEFKPESKSDFKTDFRADFKSDVRPSSASQDNKNFVRGYRLRSQEESHKYLTGPEIALSAIIALASISKLRTDQSMWQTDSVALVQNYSNHGFASQDFVIDNRSVGKNDVASAVDAISIENEGHEVAKKAVFIRPKILIGTNDSLASIAEQLFNDAGIAWLILKLNIDLQPMIIEGKTVVRLRSRQEIVIPVYQDILDFQKIRTREMAGSNLITVVEENQIDREIVDLAIAPMLGHKSSNTDPLQPLQVVPDEDS